MNWNIVFAAQAVLASACLYAATLWPVTGGSAVLIPIHNRDNNQLWQWVAAENAAIISVEDESVRVQVPSQASLFRAVSQGLLPVGARASGCISPQAASEGSNSIS